MNFTPRSGLVVEVPEAEAVVGAHRTRLDPSAALGMPAHITVLFPFVPPSSVDDELRRRVRRLVSVSAPFTYRLVDVRWFDRNVVWLAPDDAGRLRDLTERAAAEFPDCPPWQGEFSEIIPHLTIGQGATLDAMQAAARDVRAGLPIDCVADSVSLFVQLDRSGRWRRLERFPLGSDDPFELRRFVSAQDDGGTYQRALVELRDGRKVSHWMWFVFPQVAGLGQSATSRSFAISGLAEARAYLAHPVLGPRLRSSAAALLDLDGRSANDIFGPVDEQKLRSSMTLFARADRDANDDSGRSVFTGVLDRYFAGVADPATDAELARRV